MSAASIEVREPARTLAAWVTIAHPLVAKWVAQLPVNEVWFDLEHGYISMEALPALVMAAGPGRRCWVRLPAFDASLLENVWNAGAAGVIIPHVRSGTTVTGAVAAAETLRIRGHAKRSRSGPDDTSRPEIGILIEDAQGAEAAEEILSVPGLNLVVIGRKDLGRSLGTDSLSEPVRRCTVQIMEAARTHQVPAALGLPPDGRWPNTAWAGLAARADLLTVGHDYDFISTGGVQRIAAANQASDHRSEGMDKLWNVGCKVDDLQRDVAFFESLGAKVRVEETVERPGMRLEYALLDWASTRLYLTPSPVFEEKLPTALQAGLTHLVVEVDSVPDAVERAVTAGATVRLSPEVVEGGFGIREIAFVQSPGGVIIEFIKILEDRLA